MSYLVYSAFSQRVSFGGWYLIRKPLLLKGMSKKLQSYLSCQEITYKEENHSLLRNKTVYQPRSQGSLLPVPTEGREGIENRIENLETRLDSIHLNIYS